jgi:hypothetical protein
MPPRAKTPAADSEQVGLVEPAATVVGKNGFGNEPTAVLLASDLLRWVIPKVGLGQEQPPTLLRGRSQKGDGVHIHRSDFAARERACVA